MPNKIEKIDTKIVDVPTIRPHVLSMTSINRQVMTFVFIHCSDGTVGIGEGTTIGGLAYGDESPEGIKLVIDRYFTPLLLNQDADRPAMLMQRLRQNIVGNHFAKNAVETALLDAQGQRLALPLYTLLGGAMRHKLPVLWTLASGNTAKDIEEAHSMLEAGRHDTFKLKIGKRTLDEDVAHVAAIKKELGDRASVRVDVNQAWDFTTAKRGVQMLADAGVALVEQPLSGRDLLGMERLVGTSAIAIMADEALQGPCDAMEIARRGAANVFSIKPSQAGGLSAACDVAAIGHAAHIALYGGTMLEGGVGTAASAHLCACLPSLEWGTELFGPLLQTEDILAEPLIYSDFALQVPSGPGLGVRLDMDKVRHFDRAQPKRTLVTTTSGETV